MSVCECGECLLLVRQSAYNSYIFLHVFFVFRLFSHSSVQWAVRFCSHFEQKHAPLRIGHVVGRVDSFSNRMLNDNKKNPVSSVWQQIASSVAPLENAYVHFIMAEARGREPQNVIIMTAHIQRDVLLAFDAGNAI